MIVCFIPIKQSLASPSQDFNKGWRSFHKLLKNPSKAKYRSYWLEVKDLFWKAYNQSPQGPYAPKSLYYLGRTYQELGKRSYLKKDFLKSIDYFQRVVLHFPKHSWSDDAKLFKAKIHLNNLDEPNKAYLDLLYIIHNYPNGDKLSEAKQMLRKLDKSFLKEAKIDKKSKEAKSISSLNKLIDIRHWSSEDYTRVVLDLDEETKYNHFLLKPDPELNTPHRLVVDLNRTRLAEELDDNIIVRDGILQKVRTGQYRKHKSRVVLDIKKLGNYRVFSLENPFRVVLDVHSPKSQEQKLLSQELQDKNISGSLITQLGLDIQTIMIDPGHGGKDPGAVYNGILEKDINLRLAKILGSILKSKGMKVLYTRTNDKFIPLEERTALANSKKADLFISLHVNANQNKKVNGFEIYYLNLATSKDAIRVAARENAVSTKKISDLQVILTDLMLNSKIKESKNLANIVLNKTLEYGRKHYSINDHGVRKAPFYVLMGAQMPAILVEIGYITNFQDRKKIQSTSYLKQLARGITRGILAYRENIQKFARLE